MSGRFRIVFIIFLFIETSGDCQSIYKHFRELTAPEKCWAIKHLFVAKKAYRVTQEARTVTSKVLKDSLLDQFANGGQADAFRHTYWMARLTMVIGMRRARSLGIAHEKGNYKSFKKAIYEDGALPDKQSTLMDLYNNDVGILIGEVNKKGVVEDLEYFIIIAIKNGTMKILKRDAQGRFLDCDGHVVELSKTEKTWDLPYCLIPSNQLP